MNSNQKNRSKFVMIVIVVCAIMLILALYWIQIVNGETYAAKADKQYGKPANSLFDRGTIYFESKDGTRVSAAGIGHGYTIYMNPSLLTNAERDFEAVSQYIDIDKEDFLQKAGKVNDRYEILAEKQDEKVAQAIRGLTIQGIGVISETWRIYPGGSLASQVLGLIGESASTTVATGKYGLERSYESYLTRDGIGSDNVFAEIFGGSSSSRGIQGDIVTTIEPTAQKYLEKVLLQAEKTWHSDELGGIVIDPKTGEVIAMASLPDFDPNSTSNVKNVSVFSNPLVEHVYELGSIMKPLTMAMALDTGVVTSESKYEDTGTMTLSGKKISNYDGVARGMTSMQEILSQSLNMGAATLALKVGQGEFLKYFTDLGLKSKTGIDLPNEASGLSGDFTREIEIATAAYGQGPAVSPMAMTRALSVLANKGRIATPHLVKGIELSDGTFKDILPEISHEILDPKTAEEVTRMLVKVVDDKISVAHPDIKSERYSIAAKTGTAQIADRTKGGYYTDRYLHSFFGYFPAYDPKFLVFLYHVYPKGAEYASETLTDPFSDLAKFLINYYDIKPDR